MAPENIEANPVKVQGKDLVAKNVCTFLRDY